MSVRNGSGVSGGLGRIGAERSTSGTGGCVRRTRAASRVKQQGAPAACRTRPPALPQRRERRRHLVLLVLEQPGDDQRLRARGQPARQLEQQRPHQVGRDGRRRAAAARCAGRAARREPARRRWRARCRASPRPPPARCRARATGPEAEPRGGDRQHARAAAEVGERAARLELQQQLEAQPRGRVRAGAEGLRRGRSRGRARPSRGSRPRRAHPEPPADEHRPVELAPALGPVVGDLAAAHAHAHAADLGLAARERGQLAGRAVEGELDPAVAVDLLEARRAPARAAPRARARRPRAGRADREPDQRNARLTFAEQRLVGLARQVVAR